MPYYTHSYYTPLNHSLSQTHISASHQQSINQSINQSNVRPINQNHCTYHSRLRASSPMPHIHRQTNHHPSPCHAIIIKHQCHRCQYHRIQQSWTNTYQLHCNTNQYMLLSIFVTSQQLTITTAITFLNTHLSHIHFYNHLTKPASLFTLTHINCHPAILYVTLQQHINAILHSFLSNTTQSFTFTI